jgi:acetaldehyde dehydrogenase/alcohol dehydrogenase
MSVDNLALYPNNSLVIDSNTNLEKIVNLIMNYHMENSQSLNHIQYIIVTDEMYELVKQKLMCNNAYFLSNKEKEMLSRLFFTEERMSLKNIESVEKIARLAGIQLQRELYGCKSEIYCPLPSSYKLLIAEIVNSELETCIYKMLPYPIMKMYRTNS